METEFPAEGAQLLRSMARWLIGDSAGAVRDAEAVVEDDPSNGAAHFHLAFFLQKTGRKDAAGTHFTKAFEIYPDMMKTIAVLFKQSKPKKLQRFFQEEANEAQWYMPGKDKPKTPPTPTERKNPSDDVQVELYEVNLKPDLITPGTQVELSVEYRIDDESVLEGRITVELTYFILRGTDVLLQQSGDSPAMIGQNSRSKVVFAAGNRGNYSVKVRLKYRNKTAERTIPMVIR